MHLHDRVYDIFFVCLFALNAFEVSVWFFRAHIQFWLLFSGKEKVVSSFVRRSCLKRLQVARMWGTECGAHVETSNLRILMLYMNSETCSSLQVSYLYLHLYPRRLDVSVDVLNLYAGWMSRRVPHIEVVVEMCT
jgi:hypothetical protein